MKNILLASTALVAFAGAAFAEGHTGISFSGSANLGYNDEVRGDNDGFYSDLDISAGFAAELDNGLTAAASLNLDNLDSGNTDDGKDYSLSLSSETAGLFYGDTNFAAQTHWSGAGDMESDGFSEADGEVALRGDVKVGTVDTSISYALIDSDNVTNTLDDLTQLSIGASTDLGNVNVKMAYQENTNEGGYTGNGDFNKNDVFGLSLGTSFAGADVRLAYAEDNDSDSTGLKVAYPFGPVTATAYVVSESVGKDNTGINLSYSSGPLAVALDIQDDQGTSLTGLEGSYDIGNGIMAYAGYLTKDAKDDRFYVAGTYDLGSGASLGMSYAEDKDDVDGDETGAGDYQQGTTVEVSFKF